MTPACAGTTREWLPDVPLLKDDPRLRGDDDAWTLQMDVRSG